MAMVSVKLLAEEMGLGVNDVRRIARNLGISRYKDNKVEMYNDDDFGSFGNQKMKKRTLTAEHKAKLNAKKK
jgi:hypothetical protein|tara:strand:+ start:889 stop:1104 length:216 start_codon:yes stop_codon:yes gene_type:complete